MSVEGRTDEALVFPLSSGGTATVVPLALTTVMEDDACVHDFQVTQTAPNKLQVRLGSDEHGIGAQTFAVRLAATSTRWASARCPSTSRSDRRQEMRSAASCAA